jgi:hypothetical protein
LQVFTSSWFTPLPPDHVRIGISRGTPRGVVAGYRTRRLTRSSACAIEST